MRVAPVFPTDRVAYLMRARLMQLQEHGTGLPLCGDRFVERLRDCKLEFSLFPLRVRLLIDGYALRWAMKRPARGFV